MILENKEFSEDASVDSEMKNFLHEEEDEEIEEDLKVILV